MNIIFLGSGSFKEHKRGVENVIETQALSYPFEKIYYVHWGNSNTAYKHDKYICISVKNSMALLFFTINKILKRIKTSDSILHSHNPLMSFCYFGKTDIFTIHDGLYYQTNSKGYAFYKKILFFFIEKLTYKKVKIAHFISFYSMKMSLWTKKDHYHVIPNTSYLEKFIQRSSLNFNDAFKLKDRPIKVFSVRSIEERARFDLLLDIAQKLEKTHQFIVAGKGPLLEFYKNEVTIRGLKNLIFLGFVSDSQLEELYRNTDLVLTLAEYGEGFGLPLIESYLFNKPVYASNKCAMPEVIIDKEYLVENTVETIIEKLSNPIIMEGMDYRAYYDKHYSNDIISQQIRRLYTRIHDL